MDVLKGIDSGAYYFFRFQASRHPGLAQLLERMTALADYAAPLAVLLFALAILLLRRQLRAVLGSAVVFALAVLVVEALRRWIARSRPDDAQDLLGAEEMTGSYPARSVFLFTLAVLLLAFALGGALSRWPRVVIGVAAALLIVAMCLSQLLLGLHYVSDVLGGLFGGSACALLAWLLAGPRRPAAAG